MGDIFRDYESRICADWLNKVDWAVEEALGAPTTPTEARQFINAVEEAPNDATPYVRKGLAWISVASSAQHNEFGGRDAPDAHPLTAITGLDARLTGIEGDIADVNADISSLTATVGDVAGRMTGAEADIDTLQGEMVTAQADILTNAGDISALDGRVTANEGDISDLQTDKADVSYVDAQDTALGSTLLGLIIALG